MVSGQALTLEMNSFGQFPCGPTCTLCVLGDQAPRRVVPVGTRTVRQVRHAEWEVAVSRPAARHARDQGWGHPRETHRAAEPHSVAGHVPRPPVAGSSPGGSSPGGSSPGGVRPAGSRSTAPPTIALVISRKARKEAAASAAAESRVDSRLETIERVLAGLQIGGNAFVLALSATGWLWLAAQHSAHASPAPAQKAGTSGVVADNAPGGIVTGSPLLHPLVTASGATLVLVMLATCLLLAPVVNPFYAPPREHRLLHASTTVLFGVLAMTTVAVIASAAR
jgi:hypothetical protein